MAYRPTIPVMEVMYTILLCILPVVFSLSNMYQQKSAAYSNAATGKTCFNFTEYKPKCGFKTIIKSPVPLNKVSFSDQSVEQLNNYTFITTNNSQWNGDLSGRSPDFCSEFQYSGSFGSTTPSLFVAWYCICDASTNQTCKVVYEENTTSSSLQTQQSSSTTNAMQSSTFDSFTSISASSTPATFSTAPSSNIDESIYITEGTPLVSKSNVEITTGINPSITSPVTIYQTSLVSATNEDRSSLKSVYSSNTDQMLLINPATTDAVYPSLATIPDLYRSSITSGTPSTVRSATSNIISSPNNHEAIATTSTLSTSEAITTSSTIITVTSNIMNPSSTDTGHENVATTNTIYSSMTIIKSATKTTIPTITISSISTSLANDLKFSRTSEFLITQKDATVKLTVSTVLAQPTIVSSVSHNSLTTFSYLTPSPTAPSALTKILGILPSLFTSLTTIYGLGSVTPTNPTSSTTFDITFHLQSTKISTKTPNTDIATWGLTSTQLLFAPLSMHTDLLDSAWETAESITKTLRTDEISSETLPTSFILTTNTLITIAESSSSILTTTSREVSQIEITTRHKTTPHETFDVTHELRIITSDPVALLHHASLSPNMQSTSTATTHYTSSDTFASVTVSTRKPLASTTELLLSSSEFFPTNSMTTTYYKTSSETLTYTTAPLVSSQGFFATVSMATISQIQTSFEMTSVTKKYSSSFITATKVWSTSSTFQENKGTTAAIEEHLSSTPASTGVTLLSIISPPLIFASTNMPPESTRNTIFTTTASSSSVYIGDEASATSTVSLLATTSDKPVETKLPWSIHLSKIENSCYTGQRLTTLTSVKHLLDCAARCIRDTTCNGVNFSKSTKQCDLVDDERISSTWEMSSGVDCMFWEMVWKQ